MEKRLRAAEADVTLSPNNARGAAGGANVKYPRPASAGALSPSTIKPTRLMYDTQEGEFVEAGAASWPDGDMAAAANGVPLRQLYSLDRRSVPATSQQPYPGGGGGARQQPRRAQSALGSRYSAVQRPSDARAAPLPVLSSSSPSRGARLNRSGAGAVSSPTHVNSAADVAAWRKRYYPTASEIQQSRLRGFYRDRNSTTAAPPVCDRCCCDCCCTPGCDYARHKPGATGECLWWYN
jgi:hypothetical protein